MVCRWVSLGPCCAILAGSSSVATQILAICAVLYELLWLYSHALPRVHRTASRTTAPLVKVVRFADHAAVCVVALAVQAPKAKKKKSKEELEAGAGTGRGCCHRACRAGLPFCVSFGFCLMPLVFVFFAVSRAARRPRCISTVGCRAQGKGGRG